LAAKQLKALLQKRYDDNVAEFINRQNL